MLDDLSRRKFSLTLASILGVVPSTVRDWRSGIPLGISDEVTRNSEAIHQDVRLNASVARVYAVLTDASEFTELTKLSSMKNAAPAQIARSPGGSFAVFDGHIGGRQLELVPDRRIVQAWRVVDWPAGIYSIARFELADRGGKTQLVFDHIGFPAGQGEHLAQGWRANYWGPLEKYLA
jgi:activator of HSP90 ATPase